MSKAKMFKIRFWNLSIFLHILIPVFININALLFYNTQRFEVKVSSDPNRLVLGFENILIQKWDLYFSWHIHCCEKESKLWLNSDQYISTNTQNTKKLFVQSQQWANNSQGLYSGIFPHWKFCFVHLGRYAD